MYRRILYQTIALKLQFREEIFRIYKWVIIILNKLQCKMLKKYQSSGFNCYQLHNNLARNFYHAIPQEGFKVKQYMYLTLASCSLIRKIMVRKKLGALDRKIAGTADSKHSTFKCLVNSLYSADDYTFSYQSSGSKHGRFILLKS